MAVRTATARMKMRSSTCNVLAGVLAVLSFPASGLCASSRPNVIFFLADDLGYADISCYGATKVKTPNLAERLRRHPDFKENTRKTGQKKETR